MGEQIYTKVVSAIWCIVGLGIGYPKSTFSVPHKGDARAGVDEIKKNFSIIARDWRTAVLFFRKIAHF